MQYRGAVKRRLHTGSATSHQATGTTLLDAKGRNAGMIVAASSANFLAVVQVHAPEQAGNEEQQDEGHWPIERNLLLANGESVEVRQLRQ
jgi:folate-binding Fe-S cluster repair protein YgfZ